MKDFEHELQQDKLGQSKQLEIQYVIIGGTISDFACACLFYNDLLIVLLHPALTGCTNTSMCLYGCAFCMGYHRKALS